MVKISFWKLLTLSSSILMAFGEYSIRRIWSHAIWYSRFLTVTRSQGFILSKSYLEFTLRTMRFFGSLFRVMYSVAAMFAVQEFPISVLESLSWRFPYAVWLAESLALTVQEA